jgi:serine/threonine-protein kinase HipA
MKQPKSPTLLVRWYDGRLVGRVTAPGPTYFAYDEGWLNTGHSLAPLSVPFTTAAFRNAQEEFDFLPGFLADCLPDGWGRAVMRQDFAASGVTGSPLQMLAWVGRRGIGALQFEPEMDLGANDTHWRPVTAKLLAREAQAVVSKAPPEAFAHLRAAATPGGALPKATVGKLPDGTLAVGGDVPGILARFESAKLGLLKLHVEDMVTPRYTDGRLEHAYMQMAAAAGIRTARTELMSQARPHGTFHHLFVERFDYEPATGRRRHLVTLAGMLQRFTLTYADLLLATRTLTSDMGEVHEAVRRMIFNVRSANWDDHGKNHSFMYDDAAQQWHLSPAYDLTFNADEAGHYGGVSVQTFGRSPSRSRLAEVAAEAGVTSETFDRLDAGVTAALARWPEIACANDVPNDVATRASQFHASVAEQLSVASSGRPSRRRKLWERI